jgi:hypothetical protein
MPDQAIVQRFRYDLAFSLIGADEPLASEINERIKSRINTFLYSRRQGEIVGQEAVELFSRVFRIEARNVVILLRKQWGSTPYTRIESAAIAERVLQEGTDFLLVIKLDIDAQVPSYVPATRVWLQFHAHGTTGAAAILEQRVAESGVEVRTMTAVERAALHARRTEFHGCRVQYLGSKEGWDAASNSYDQFRLAVLRKREEIEAHIGRAPVIQEDRNVIGQVDRGITLTGERASVMARFHCPYAFTLQGAYLQLTAWEGPAQLPWYVERSRHQCIEGLTFHFDYWEGNIGAWKKEDTDFPMFQEGDLAEAFFELLYRHESALLESAALRTERG